jgi:hypothetical protein
MRAARRWLLWKLLPPVKPGGKPRKVPFYVNGSQRNGKLDTEQDRAQLCSFEEAVAALERGKAGNGPKYAGLGFALGPDGTGNCWQGIDYDALSDRSYLASLVSLLPAGYIERSPSKNGVHAIGYGRHFKTLGPNGSGIEAYSTGRYFTVTADDTADGPITCLAEYVEQNLTQLHEYQSATATKSGGGAETSDSNPTLVPEQTIRDLRGAFSFIPADDRHLWVRLGMACKTLGSTGRELWEEWSQTSPLYDAEDAARVWDSLKPTRIGYQAIFAQATRVGWVNPAGGSSGSAHCPEIVKLAALSRFDYDRVRADEAKKLCIRAATLDKEVEAARKAAEQSESNSGMFPKVELWPESVACSDLLDALMKVIQRFVVCDPYTRVAAVLWIVFSWLIEVVGVAPIALITAPEKRCGKSTLLSVLARLCRRALVASNISPAAVFRVIEAHLPTLLIDEADSFMRENEELRGVINSGHTTETAFVIRTEGDDHVPVQFSTFCAKVIAGIGKQSETIMDRSIVLALRRKLPNEHVEKLRRADFGLFDELRSKLARFAEDYAADIKKAVPEIPEGLNDRAADNWEPLLAIADIAGGPWPRLARDAALRISGSEQDAPSLSAELLSDIRAVFTTLGKSRLFTDTLLDALAADEMKPWATFDKGKRINPRQLGQLLSEYAIPSTSIRIDGENRKGYQLLQFTDAFARYLDTHGQTPHKTASFAVTPSQPNNDAVLRVTATENQEVPETPSDTPKPAPVLGCDGVTDKTLILEAEQARRVLTGALRQMAGTISGL